jgi:hypothetical protein
MGGKGIQGMREASEQVEPRLAKIEREIRRSGCGDAYPISSLIWMLVLSIISDRTKGEALIGFLRWGLTEGQNYLEPLSYPRLPNEVVVREQRAIAQIKVGGTEAQSAKN